jgi:hypothetical protein
MAAVMLPHQVEAPRPLYSELSGGDAGAGDAGRETARVVWISTVRSPPLSEAASWSTAYPPGGGPWVARAPRPDYPLAQAELLHRAARQLRLDVGDGLFGLVRTRLRRFDVADTGFDLAQPLRDCLSQLADGVLQLAPPGLLSPQRNEVLFRWLPSTDNVAVAGYLIYFNGKLLGSEPASQAQYRVWGPMTCGQPVTMSVAAYHDAGNVSPTQSVISAYAYYQDCYHPPSGGPPRTYSETAQGPGLVYGSPDITTAPALLQVETGDAVQVTCQDLQRRSALVPARHQPLVQPVRPSDRLPRQERPSRSRLLRPPVRLRRGGLPPQAPAPSGEREALSNVEPLL